MNTTSSSSYGEIDRRVFVKKLIDACPEALIVTGLGSPSYDVFAAGDRDRNFYLWGAMGGASAMALGLAIAQPQKPVLVITGDGEQLMGLGNLASIGAQKIKNLSIVVLDNGHYAETGMQKSHTSFGTDLVGVALSCGLDWAFKVKDMDAISTIASHVNTKNGTGLANVLIKAEEYPKALPPRDGVYIKNRFRSALGFKPF
ncbi:aldehyde dehydrogenase [Polynucleobacter sp. SHI8]|uniref:thiamine pyrophosphate-dependent enzyme n=1 Tax=unclassified Polynucleobacter TaxID=2640945 RepID=UPI0024906246|nr:MULTISPECIES: thiamine pyrophosphate-dependent enzyme [unclassified Polynucleobacter]BDW10343.1 aldehyde dehydrogenase [Polynucleobacter sp. SHI2]BDW12789.1 aldehyde dehydrogenase [Polynucleobacter sp. SHI8]